MSHLVTTLGIMASVLQYLKQVNFMKVPKWILANPTKSVGLGIVIGSPVIDFYLRKKISDREKITRLLKNWLKVLNLN